MFRRRNVTRCSCGWTALAMLAVLASPAAGNEDGVPSIGPVEGYSPPEFPFFVDVKSPPLQNSQPFQTTWGLHTPERINNYAGFLFSLEFDSHELSFLSVHEVGIHTGGIEYDGGLVSGVTFPGSQSTTQFVSPLAVWIDPSDAMNSGISLSASTLIPLFQIVGHAKNTTTQYNSDIDVAAYGLFIVHNPDTLSSVFVSSSFWAYKSVGGFYWATVPGQGTWYHYDQSFTTTIPASAFYASGGFLIGGAGFGIEHVPEPASMLLLLGGAGSAVIGRLRRRRA